MALPSKSAYGLLFPFFTFPGAVPYSLASWHCPFSVSLSLSLPLRGPLVFCIFSRSPAFSIWILAVTVYSPHAGGWGAPPLWSMLLALSGSGGEGVAVRLLFCQNLGPSQSGPLLQRSLNPVISFVSCQPNLRHAEGVDLLCPLFLPRLLAWFCRPVSQVSY